MARSLVKDSAQVAASPISFTHGSYQRSFKDFGAGLMDG